MIGSFPERFLYMLVNRCLPSTYLYRCICSISGSTWSGGSTKQKSLGTNCVAITSSEWSSNLNWAWKEMVPICPDGLPELFGWALIPKDCRKGSYFSKWIFGLLCLRAGIYIYIYTHLWWNWPAGSSGQNLSGLRTPCCEVCSDHNLPWHWDGILHFWLSGNPASQLDRDNLANYCTVPQG